MSDKLELSKAYTAMRGYYAGLKTCMAGLVLVSDMSVSCFLAGGEMINMMWQAGGYSSFQDMLKEATSRGGIPKKRTDLMAEAIRNAKVRITHLGHWRKAKGKLLRTNQIPEQQYLQLLLPRLLTALQLCYLLSSLSFRHRTTCRQPRLILCPQRYARVCR